MGLDRKREEKKRGREMDGLTHGSKVLLYVLGILDELEFKELVKGGYHKITDEGREEYLALKESGFKPTPEEIEAAIVTLNERPIL